ncbi:MAG: diacylglycerol kinase family protein [Chloroflexi bacterium]|nr:diacylglycerol kinase family protein [Chloroflexota bacterium]
MTRSMRRRAQNAAADPKRYSPTTSPNRIRSLGFAIAGCAYMLRHQKNTRILLAATAVVIPVATALEIDALQWSLLILTIGSVWVTEFINAAIEAAVNVSVSEIHPMAKVAKDVAAAAVLITVIVAILIGWLILGPPLFDWLKTIAAPA